MALAPRQVALAVPAERIVNGLPDMWRQAPRRWGHPLHSICSYFAMFPPALPHFFIRWLTSSGDVVYDPFSGRGTVLLEAALMERIVYGSDANPLAFALSRAKVQLPSEHEVLARIETLQQDYSVGTVRGSSDVPPSIQMLYSPRTLEQLVYLKWRLDHDCRVDQFITAMVLGLMHGNHSKRGATRGFSISMPNTFAMSPGYVRSFIQSRGLVAPDVDVFEMLRSRTHRMQLPKRAVSAGRVWQQDSTTEPSEWLRRDKAKLIFTSPPYLQTIKYGKYNWIRLWFLGHSPQAVDDRLISTSSVSKYVAFMNATLAQLRTVVRRDGYLCLIVGDVRRETDDMNLAAIVWEQVARPNGWQLLGVVNDEFPMQFKVSRIWKDKPGRATKIDRILILAPEDGQRVLPALPTCEWDKTPQWSC